MGDDAEQNGKGGGQGLVQGKKGVGCESGEQRLGTLIAKHPVGQKSGRSEPLKTKFGEQQRVARYAQQRAQEFRSQFGPMRGQLGDQRSPGFSIFTEGANRIFEVAFKDDGGAIVEGMSDRGWRVNPLQPVLVQRQGRKEGGSCRHGMYGRAEVVTKSGKRKFQGARAAAVHSFGFEDLHFEPGLGEHDGGRQPVGAGSDHDGTRGADIHWSGLTVSGISTTWILPSGCNSMVGAYSPSS